MRYLSIGYVVHPHHRTLRQVKLINRDKTDEVVPDRRERSMTLLMGY